MILKNGNIVYNSHSFRLESNGAVCIGNVDYRRACWCAVSGLRGANTGLGLIAGLSMMFIAIIADRILRGWATFPDNDKTPSLE